MPLHKKLSISASTRASWYIYNDVEDIKALASIVIEKESKF
jgi:selenocysteine lyase/cysteine desulfurase